MKTPILIFTILFSTSLSSQTFKDLYPGTSMLELSEAGEKAFLEHQKKCEAIWAKYDNQEGYEKLSQEDKDYLMDCSEVEEGYWDAIDGGCNWYCGGGPKEVTASSFLASQGSFSYEPQNAHDLNYQSVWVEGVKGYGIGEYLLYHFASTSPRITEIAVANGHVKSEAAWRNNSRVKTLKMYVNDQPYALLHLEDKRAIQRFEVAPIGSKRDEKITWEDLEKQPDWTIKFEIAEVYPGAKYDDVVISEIFFDGIDVHCLAKGTMIQTADQSQKPIELLKEGDEVLSYNFTTGQFESDKIKELANPIHEDLIELKLSDGSSIKLTQDHPLQAANGDWVSFDPGKTIIDYQFEEVGKLEVGQELKTLTGKVKIEKIIPLTGQQPTFTIVRLEKNHSFVANGVLVGTEGLRRICLHRAN
ncbi:MAG: hypothetical protein R3B93_23830 [Bacteroidia bacterium]